MTQKPKRTDAQKAADSTYESKRSTIPRFGGRCTTEQKEQLQRLMKKSGCESEKELIFKALDFFEANHMN